MRGMPLIPLMSVTLPSHFYVLSTSIFHLDVEVTSEKPARRQSGYAYFYEGVMRGICDG